MSASGGSGTGSLTFAVVSGSTACVIDSAGKLEITSGTAPCSITATRAGDANYEPITSAAHAVTIAKATAPVAITWNNSIYNGTANSASATVNGVGSETNLSPAATFTYYAGATASGTALAGAPRIAGQYTVRVSFAGNTNYNSAFADKTITIAQREGHVAYIGQNVFVTSGSSSTTAQVTLTASVADPDGTGLVADSTVTFKDLLSDKVLASGVKVSPVSNSEPGLGTANTVVTLSSGQYATQPYLIQVILNGSYTNGQQTSAPANSDAYKAAHADVVVMIPATQYSMQGALAPLPKHASSAGRYGDTTGVSYSVGLKYTASNPGGDGIGFTVVSSKTSELYYSNRWEYAADTRSWRTVLQDVAAPSAVVIN